MADVTTSIEPLEEVSDEDLEDLCDAAESAILGSAGSSRRPAPCLAVIFEVSC